MNRKALLIGLPVALLLLLAAATAFLLPEDTETDSIIGRSDTQTDAESGKSGSKLPDACSSSSSDGGGGSKAHSKGRDSKTSTEGETKQASEPDIELETALDSDPNQAVDDKTQEERDKAFEEFKRNQPPHRPPLRLSPLLAKGKARHQNVGNRRPRAHSIRNAVGVKKPKSVSDKLKQDRRGLFAKYYRFNTNPISVLMDPGELDLDSRKPDIVRIDRQVSFPNKEAWDDLPFDKGNFMAVWTGFLVIEKAADYWLFLGCDLNGRVELDGQTILLDEHRDYTEVSTVVKLEPGLHPLRIEYVESKNGSPVEALGSCNFMWVPEGKSKPEPVPAEMLLLPEELWSEDAPIITHLSSTHGKIGDEITIYGQGLEGEFGFVSSLRSIEDAIKIKGRITVSVSGVETEILKADTKSITIRIPIGAKTGRVEVFKAQAAGFIGKMGFITPFFGEYIPSNSVNLTITNQFGLIASWHNLEGWSHFDFIEPGVREPEVTQLENPPTFESREELNLEFKQNPMACTWTGKIGFPANWIAEGKYSKIRFEARGSIRVRFGGIEKTAQASDSDEPVYVDFEIASDADYVSLQIYFSNSGGPASMEIYHLENVGYEFPDGEDGSKGAEVWETTEKVLAHWFFPPVVPPSPPVVSDVKPLLAEGEEAAVLPYRKTTTRPSVREGQEFTFVVSWFGLPIPIEELFQVAIDGKRIEYEQVSLSHHITTIMTCKATMPSGLGEGRMVVRMSTVTSAPFIIDILNKGLIAYYYDLPNAGGYKSMPDLEPMACFAIRKDPWVNYDNANEFKLPFPAETFAVQWFGAIIIEEGGFYTFTTRSDDGVIVWIDGNEVVKDNDLHYQREKSGEPVFLAAGTYTFKMEFFENNIHEVCELMWQAKDGEDNTIIEKQTVPKRAFTWDQHPALPNKQATGKRTDGSDPE